MDFEGFGEGFDGRQQPLLQTGHQQGGFGLLAFAGTGIAFFTGNPVSFQQTGQFQFRRIGWQPGEFDLHDGPLGEAAADFPDIFLESAHHHIVESLLQDFHPTGETMGVEDFQQGAKAIGMTVVGCG